METGVVSASRLVGKIRGVPVDEGPGIGVGGRGQYVITLTRLFTEPVAKKVPDHWKATAVTRRVWSALLKEAVVPVDVGSGVVLVGGVVDTGTDIAVPVDRRRGVVPADRETGTVRDIPVDAKLLVQREVNVVCGVPIVPVNVGPGGDKFDRGIDTKVNTVRGVPFDPLDAELGVVPVSREIDTEVNTVRVVPVVPVDVGPGVVPVASLRRRDVRCFSRLARRVANCGDG